MDKDILEATKLGVNGTPSFFINGRFINGAESFDVFKKIIDEVVAEINASGIKDMGKVMKEVNAKIAGKADGRLVSDLVKAKLSA